MFHPLASNVLSISAKFRAWISTSVCLSSYKLYVSYILGMEFTMHKQVFVFFCIRRMPRAQLVVQHEY